jgi:hypothetical protein
MLNKDNNNGQYIEGSSRVRLIMFAFLGFWGLIGFLLKQIAENKIEQIKAVSNTTAVLNELNSIYIKYLILPMTLFCIIQGVYLLMLGIKTMRAGIYPPPGVNVPFRTKIKKGTMAKLSGIGCLFAGLCNFLIIALLLFIRHEFFRNI